MLRFAEINPIKVEDRGDFILGAESPLEYEEVQRRLSGSRGNRVFSFFGVEAPVHEASKKNILHLEQKALKKVAKAAAVKGTGETKTVSSLAQEKLGATQRLKRTKRGHCPGSKAARAPKKARTEEPIREVEGAGCSCSPFLSDTAIPAQPLHQALPDSPPHDKASSPQGSLMVSVSPFEPESDEWGNQY